MALYDPFGVDVPLNFDITHSLDAASRSSGDWGLIPDRVTPKDVKNGRFVLLSLAPGWESVYWSE